MCGICGILNFDRTPVNKNQLLNMNKAMALRGPDDTGHFLEKNFGMAMRRLSIIDIDGGHQPITNEDRTIHVVLNGEIYNYLELRKDLESLGHCFTTRSDTEVLVHLYEEYGTKAVDHLNGMFAFSLWDSTKKRLWLVRDRLGIKPLVYFEHSDGILFASTLDALACHPIFHKEIDMDSLLLYFTLAYVPTPRTIWKNARKLPPGHWLLVENNKVRIEKYWHLRPALRSRTSKEEFEEKISEIFRDSIELHSRSDVPVGTFLSGGLDSSAVTALFCQRTNKPVHTFSMDFEGKDFNEGHFAKLVADSYHTAHHPYTLEMDQALLELDNLLPLMDEPMADSAIIPSYCLSKWAREKNIAVILSGAGGDELFGGYHRHYRGKWDLVAGRLSGISLSFWHFMNRMINSKIMHYGSLSWNKGAAFGISTSGVHLGMFDHMLNNSSTFNNAMELTKQKFSNLPAMENDFGLGYGRMLADIQNYLVDNVLPITDKTSMAASVEARVPLLDHRLVELAFSVPPEINLGKDFIDAKKSLKSVVNMNLPTDILNRPKTGFNAPINSWIHTGNSTIGERLSNLKHPALREMFNQQTIIDIWSDERKRKMSSESLFMLFIADNWLESHA